MPHPSLAPAVLQAVTESPTRIEPAGVTVPLTVGLGVAALTAVVALLMAARRGDRRFLVDPPAVFSLTDGWLTNLTGLSAAAVAVVATTDVAEAVLDEHIRLEMAFVGLVAVAALGLAPLVLGLLTRFDTLAGRSVTVTPTWVYALASSLAAGAAAAQLTSLGRAAGELKQLRGMRPVLVGACVVMALLALVYAGTFIDRTLGFASPWPARTAADGSAGVPDVPVSLSL